MERIPRLAVPRAAPAACKAFCSRGKWEKLSGSNAPENPPMAKAFNFLPFISPPPRVRIWDRGVSKGISYTPGFRIAPERVKS